MGSLGTMLILFFVSFPVWAAGPYPDQVLHEKVLFKETWRGAGLESIYNSQTGIVRIQYCGAKAEANGHYFSNVCIPIHPNELHFDDLDVYQAPIIDVLTSTESRLRQILESRWLSKYWHQAGNDLNLIALDQVISDLKKVGLKNWVQMQNPRSPSPEFTSPEVADTVVASMTEVLNQPVESLRQDQVAHLIQVH
jgi:hypothetical protein